MINYDEHDTNMVTRLTVTQFRKHLARYIATVRYGGDYVCIQRKGQDPVYLVSRADMDLIWERSDDLEIGPRKDTGYRSGEGLMRLWREFCRGDGTRQTAKGTAPVGPFLARAEFSCRLPRVSSWCAIQQDIKGQRRKALQQRS